MQNIHMVWEFFIYGAVFMALIVGAMHRYF